MQSPDQINPDTWNRRTIGLGILLILATFLAYWQVPGHGFVNFDDPEYVTANPTVQAGLTRAGIQWAFTQSHASNWQPITFLSHMLDCQLFGLNPAGPHIVNVLFHATNTLLLFLLLQRLTSSLGASATVAALFAVHPLHVESVAWISERKDVLSLFFGLLVIWCYVEYVRRRKLVQKRFQFWYLAALVLFSLGLMTKPMLVTWPFLLLLLDFWPLLRIAKFSPAATEGSGPAISIIRLIWEKIPFFALALISSVITFSMQQADGAVVESLPLSYRLAHIPAAYAIYLVKTFWPTDLSFFYPYVTRDWTSFETLGGLVLLVGITSGISTQFRRYPYLVTGWFWFIGTMVPVIGLVQVGRQDVADRYTYVPHIGLFLALVWFAQEKLSGWRISRQGQLALALTLIMACGWLTLRQVPNWKNDRVMAEQGIRADPRNFFAHATLASVCLSERNYAAALIHCRLSLQYQPLYADAHDLMGTILLAHGQLPEAIESYHEAIRLKPRLAQAYEGLADVYLRQGRFEEAEQASRTAANLNPSRLEVRFLLARALQGQNRFDEALALYQQLTVLKPDSHSVLRGLGSIYAMKGENAAALSAFESAVRLQPTNSEVHNSLGMLKLERNEIMAASNHFSLAATFQPTNSLANFQLGNLLTAAQQPAMAAIHYRLALVADPNQPELLNNFAWLLATSWDDTVRNGNEAVRLAERGCELTQEQAPLFLGTLAAAYAEAGRFNEAIQTTAKAIEIAKAKGLEGIAARNEELRARYQKSLPFREARQFPPTGATKDP